MMGTVSVKSESTVNRRLSQGICKGKSINIDQNAPKVTQQRTLFDPWDAPWGMRGRGRKRKLMWGTLFNFEYKWSANAFVCSGTFLKKLYSDPNV